MKKTQPIQLIFKVQFSFSFNRVFRFSSTISCYDPSEEHPTVKAIYDLDGVTEFYQMCKEWCDKGYWSKSDVGSSVGTAYSLPLIVACCSADSECIA